MSSRYTVLICILTLVWPAAGRAADEGAYRGLVVVLNASDPEALEGLAERGSGLIHGLVSDSSAAAALNRELLKRGRTGEVTVCPWDGLRIPFVSDTVNIVVADGENVSDDARRVLAPYGRVVDSAGKMLWEKPWPDEIDEWTHYLHTPNNNAVAQDMKVSAPRRVKWLAGPLMSRHHDHLPSLNAMVTSRGRVFYIYDEGPTSSILFPPKWRLIARDAFNGVVLWKRDLEEWLPHLWPLKSMPATLPRRLVSIGDDLFVTLGIHAPVTQVSAIDGTEKRVFAGSERCEEIIVTGEMVLALCLTGTGPLDDLVDDARGKKLDPRATKFPVVQGLMAGVMSPYWLHAERRLIAYDRDTGDELWRYDGKFAPLSLASAGKRVYWHNGESIVALNAEDGAELWTSEEVPIWDQFHSWYGASLVLHDDVVLFSGAENMTSRPTGTPSGGRDTMTAFSAVDGRKLWTGEHLASGYRSPEDLFVVQGLVWAPDSTGRSKSMLKGLDPQTGEAVREMEIDFNQGFHHRCYAGRATERFMISSKVGINTVAFDGGAMTQDNWVRGTCGYGIMPANGMIYATPDPCNCFPESKLDGFVALSGADAELAAAREASAAEGLLEKGEEAITADLEALVQETDEWPTLRGDAARSGSTDVSLPVSLERAWKCDLGGSLTAPVVAGGKVYLASVDEHTVIAVDAAEGDVVWTHVAGGRVDSPPTVVGRLLYFGSADGTVSCLDTRDGKLQWRRRLAPRDERIVKDERIESVWPVHGSVLYYNDLIYAIAGRSMFVDGGLTMCGLDPLTGRVVHEQNHQLSGQKTRGLGGSPAKPDILSAAGENIFMRSLEYDLACMKSDASVAHLFSSNGFLNDTWFDRAFWTYGSMFAAGSAGVGITGKKNHSGRIMVSDDSHLFGFGRTKYGWGSAFEYKLYKAAHPVPIDPAERRRGEKIKKGAPLWAVDLPILVRCMVKAGERLFVAGPKRLFEADDIQLLDTPEVQAQVAAQAEALDQSAELLVVSAADGRVEKAMSLGFAPAWDGMAVTEGKLFISGKDACLYCFE